MTDADVCVLSGYETASGSSPQAAGKSPGQQRHHHQRPRQVRRPRRAMHLNHESQAIAIHVDSALTVIRQPERQIDPQSEFQSSDSLACISIGMTN